MEKQLEITYHRGEGLKNTTGKTTALQTGLKRVKSEPSDDFDKQYKEISNGMKFKDPISILANKVPSSTSLNNESTFSLANTISTKSISTSGTSFFVNTSNAMGSERDIMNTFLDLDRLIESCDEQEEEEEEEEEYGIIPQTPTFSTDNGQSIQTL